MTAIAATVAIAGVSIFTTEGFASVRAHAASGGAKCPKLSAEPGQIGSLVAYVCGKNGAANPKAKPIVLGWVNNQGGSIVSNGPEATAAAELAVKWINQHGGGVQGHPLQLSTCFVKNSEQEGLGCAEQFLNNKAVRAVTYGSVSVGADTINSTINGKLPIIEGFSQNFADVTNPNTYIVYVASPFDFFGWGTFAKDVLHAKTAAVLYENGAGFIGDAQNAAKALRAEGIQTKLVGFAQNSSDLAGAFAAAGATSAGMVAPLIAGTSTCVAANNALKQLGVDPAKVAAIWTCGLSSQKSAYGGDLPHWWYGQAQSGDQLTNDPEGVAYRKVLKQYGATANVQDAWYSGMFGLMLTIDRWLNQIGAKNITSKAIAQKAKTFRGPILLGQPVVVCGKYPKSPGNCGDGDRFFRYQGNDSWVDFPKWVQTPCPIQKQLHASDACKANSSLVIN